MLLALVLLGPPLPLSRGLRRFVLKSRRNASADVMSMLRPWQNWFDLARAAAGAYILMGLAIRVDPEVKGAATEAFIVQGGILGLAVLVQTLRYADEIRVIAPIFYLSGLTVVVAGYAAGGFAVFAAWLFVIGGRKLIFHLPIMAVALVGAGYVLGAISLPLILNALLILIPLFLAFLCRQQMVYVAREPVAFG